MLGSYIKFYTFAGADSWTINDHVSHPLRHAESPYYFISVDNVDGATNSDISYESHPIPNATGEKSGDVFRRGKTITLSGKITALNLGALYTGVDYLQNMFTETGLRKLVFKRLSDNVVVYYKGRVNQDLTIVETFQDGKYAFDWVVGIRTDTPFTYNLSGDAIYPSWQS